MTDTGILPAEPKLNVVMDIMPTRNLRYRSEAILAGLFALLIETIAIFNVPFGAVIVLGCVLVGFAIRKTYGPTLLLLAMLLSNDLSRTFGTVVKPIASLYTFPNMNIGITLILILFVITMMVRAGRIPLDRGFSSFLGAMIFLAALSFILGSGNLTTHLRHVVHDLSYFVNTVAFALFTYLIFDTKEKLRLLLFCVIAAISAKYSLLAIQFFLGYGNVVGSLVQVVFDTGKKMVPIFAVLFFLLWISRREMKMTYTQAFFAALLFVVCLVLSLSVASRSTLLFLLVMLVVASSLQGKNPLKFLKIMVIMSISLVIAVLILNKINPGGVNFILWKLRTFMELDITQTKFSSTSPVIRYISLLNIYYQHLRDFTLLQGAGAGSYFTQDFVAFPFSLYDKTAFSESSIRDNQFFKPHTTPIFLFLKIGALGTFYYYYAFVRIFFNVRRYLKHIDDEFLRLVAITIITSIPVLSINNFSSKMQIVSGILVGIVFAIQNKAAVYHPDETSRAI